MPPQNQNSSEYPLQQPAIPERSGELSTTPEWGQQAPEPYDEAQRTTDISAARDALADIYAHLPPEAAEGELHIHNEIPPVTTERSSVQVVSSPRPAASPFGRPEKVVTNVAGSLDKLGKILDDAGVSKHFESRE